MSSTKLKNETASDEGRHLLFLNDLNKFNVVILIAFQYLSIYQSDIILPKYKD
jgi:hypothetical protein